MKLFIFTTVLLATTLAGAHEQDYKQLEIQETPVFSPLCPEEGTCVTDGTQIELTYRVNCFETLVSYTYEVVPTEEKTVLIVSGLLRFDVADMITPVVRCSSFDTVVKMISLPNVYGDVEVIHMR